MARRALILVEGHRSIGPLYVNAARRLGLHPITLSADPARYDYLVAAESLEAVRVDTGDLDALIRECSRLRASYDIAGIVGLSGDDESIYATAAKLCQYFDVPGPNPASIERCCDKFSQRRLLEEAGVPIPAYRLAANAADVENSAAEIGLPVIVKPAAGTGSGGVRLCRNMDELAEHTIYLLGEKDLWRSSPRLLIEEFAHGQQYSVNTMGNEVIAVGEVEFYGPPNFVVCNSMYPAILDDYKYRIIEDASLSCLDSLDLGWGPANIELRWTKRGPVIIEVNPRLPGWTTPQLIELAYGVDPIAEHLNLAMGQEWDFRRRHSHTAAARFLVPERDGVLDWIEGDSLAASIPGVAEIRLYAESKSPIVRKGDFRDTIGHVIAVGASRAETEAILLRAIGLIGWSITPFPTLGE
ncbi:acetyl-CoA carboxylase biotin carboxylase subunit family protein [Mesorhizobium sp. M0923]|uniref:ATP-grasp domain-containing protein n=1 Tax=Mesorhizobium sp. M0923 TaxID=2957028 RepID=UPI00333D0E11